MARGSNTSGSHRSNVQLALDTLGLNGLFDLIVSGDDIKMRKPDPGPFLHAAQKLGVLPQECIAIEDSYSGMLSVRNAGMKLICVESHPSMDLGKCEIVIKDFRSPAIMKIFGI